jgi:hypothetical protein
MKIIKEVTIKAALNDTWFWLVENENLRNLRYSEAKSAALGAKSKVGANVPRISIDPPRKLSIRGGAISPNIITTFDLVEQGDRTGLKVTISGWETIDPEMARLEMPRVSLAWEKKLGFLKKTVESVSRTHK